MAMVTSKEFNQRASAVLKLSETEPVYITKWGKVVSVLANYAYFLAQQNTPTLAEAFSTDNSALLSTENEQIFEEALNQVRNERKLREFDLSEWE